mmetsp:Transcript_102261/g.284880  ORF Transcript_102261/g.284880 Transcript_102261/m.284880 type:complete len:221 (+) Transcript_102261:1346-2008(+)
MLLHSGLVRHLGRNVGLKILIIAGRTIACSCRCCIPRQSERTIRECLDMRQVGVVFRRCQHRHKGIRTDKILLFDVVPTEWAVPEFPKPAPVLLLHHCVELNVWLAIKGLEMRAILATHRRFDPAEGNWIHDGYLLPNFNHLGVFPSALWASPCPRSHRRFTEQGACLGHHRQRTGAGIVEHHPPLGIWFEHATTLLHTACVEVTKVLDRSRVKAMVLPV